MDDETQEITRQMLRHALRHIRSGLDLLDRARAPGQIGAHVDLAVHLLERTLSSDLEDLPAQSDAAAVERPAMTD
jgi:hypothetical protein